MNSPPRSNARANQLRVQSRARIDRALIEAAHDAGASGWQTVAPAREFVKSRGAPQFSNTLGAAVRRLAIALR